MENLIGGILTILFCCIGFFFAGKFYREKKYNKTLFLIIICGLLLRIFVSTDFYLHDWDEKYHALVAKNLIEHPLKPTLYEKPILPYDYKSWVGNHIWLHKQPLPLWTMAFSMWIFGVNEIALRLPTIVISTLCILLMCLIASYFYNKRIGLLASFLFSIHGLIIELTGGRVATDHIDIFFLFFILCAVFFTIKFIQGKKMFYNVLAGLCIGSAILTKWLPALIVLPIWILLVVDSKKFAAATIYKHFVILIVVCTLIFLPWQIYIHKMFPLEAAWESEYNFRHITEVIEERGGPFYYHFNKVRMLFGEIIYLPLIWFFWKSFKKFSRLKMLAISIWFLVPFLFFSLAKTKMPGYMLFTAPAIFIITSIFWWYLFNYRNKFKFKWIANIILILLLILPVRYSVERIKPFQYKDRNPEWAKKLRDLNNVIKGEHVVIFNIDRPIEVMFYTNFIAYSSIPDNNQIKKLIDTGYEVIINKNDKVDKTMEKINGVKIMSII